MVVPEAAFFPDETAVREQYGRQNPTDVAGELAAAAGMLAARYATVDGVRWQRTGFRSDGAAFTIDSFTRYLIHDPVHHVHDAERGYERLRAAAADTADTVDAVTDDAATAAAAAPAAAELASAAQSSPTPSPAATPAAVPVHPAAPGPATSIAPGTIIPPPPVAMPTAQPPALADPPTAAPQPPAAPLSWAPPSGPPATG